MVASTRATDIGFAAESAFLTLVIDLSPRFRGALEALRSVPVAFAVADEIDFWSNSGALEPEPTILAGKRLGSGA